MKDPCKNSFTNIKEILFIVIEKAPRDFLKVNKKLLLNFSPTDSINEEIIQTLKYAVKIK